MYLFFSAQEFPPSVDRLPIFLCTNPYPFLDGTELMLELPMFTPFNDGSLLKDESIDCP